MIELGKKQKLLVVKTVDFGIYLGEDRNAPQNERVLLPSKQVPEGTKAGDELAEDHYRNLELKASDCISCGHCNERCPFGTDQVAKMKEIAEYFDR